MNVTKVDQKKGKIIGLLLSHKDEPYALPIAKKLLVQSTEEYSMCCEIRRKFACGHGSVGWRQASLFEWDCEKTAQPNLVGDELVPLRIYICTYARNSSMFQSVIYAPLNKDFRRAQE